ncbi:MAG TPA: SCO family protein [Chitinophagales bacterium]|nr:SCO family protein [Chitinophagales bacterium]
MVLDINKGNRGCLIAGIIGVIFPLIFFVIFKYMDTNREQLNTDTCLPIYGNKTLNNSKDTVYHIVPSFSFLDQNGDTITDAIMQNKVVVADFFFTTCSSICIDMTKNLRKIQEHFLNDRDVMILSYTVDPEVDSVKQLQKYAVENDVNGKLWHLLTGDKKELYALARNGYLVTAVQGDGGPKDFIHSEKLVLVDKERRIRGFYDGTKDDEIIRLKKDAQKLLVSYIIIPEEDK